MRYETTKKTATALLLAIGLTAGLPQLAGAENASKPGEFHSRIEPIVRAHAVLEGLSCGRPSSDEASVSKKRDMEQYARVRGFLFARR